MPIVFWSDHREFARDHDLFAKGHGKTEEILQHPAFAPWLGRVPAECPITGQLT